MASGYANLLEQKKAFTQERSSVLIGWDTYMAGVMSERSIPGENFSRIFEDP